VAVTVGDEIGRSQSKVLVLIVRPAWIWIPVAVPNPQLYFFILE
jgi:hypothetical protein